MRPQVKTAIESLGYLWKNKEKQDTVEYRKIGEGNPCIVQAEYTILWHMHVMHKNYVL